ncbi:MAG: 2-hydroxyacyl-CoA dehydratase [Deltaproteobacteria bacterium]|nr:2-hydroxyacyl-CoA dehydratase [Deltaproteobacteria bacterium]
MPINNADRKSNAESPMTYFQSPVENGLAYAVARKKEGARIVGIMCEYTPRELILAADGVPVCLCGGSAEMAESAEKVLPSNLCPIIKSTFGYSLEKENPFLEMSDLLVAETTCDGKKKMYELLAEKHPMHVLELPQKPDDRDAFKHWETELHKLKGALEKQFSTRITDKKLRDAIGVMNRERKLKRALAALLKSEKPPLTGRELLEMKSLISAIPGDLEQYEKVLLRLNGRTISPSAESRVRVMLTGVPLPHGAERVLEIMEDSGGLVVCQENCTGYKPVQEDVDETVEDPLQALAEKYFHLPCSVMTRNLRRLDQLRALAGEYRVECLIELIWQACLTYDVESSWVKRLAEEELNVPYLRLETDFSPSDSARIALRVQSLYETVKGRKGSHH